MLMITLVLQLGLSASIPAAADARNVGALPPHINGATESELWNLFEAFKQNHGCLYSGVEEEKRRFAAFRDNVEWIKTKQHDGKSTHTVGIGPFADLTPAEFLSRYTSPSPPIPSRKQWADESYMGEHKARSGEEFPPELDWVAKGAVTAVKSQRCGNCWTFSAAGSIEGAYAIAKKKLTNFSEQEFVDCIDTGCNGGWNFNALKFAVNHTVCTLEDFPCTGKGNGSVCYLWEESPCSKATTALHKGELSGWKSVGEAKWGHTTEEDLMSALQLGPVSINMFADHHMAHYSGGVLSYSNCSEGTNHGVLAVGYGTCHPGATTGPCANVTETIDYWKVKNSWGTKFGVEGYFYLARGKFQSGCGTASTLLTNPSYPIMRR